MIINKTVLKKWTPAAIDCYNIGCRCSECKVNKIMKDKCRMKAVVLELVRIFGKPKKDDIESYILKD